jgi:hypothetical protein
MDGWMGLRPEIKIAKRERERDREKNKITMD